MVRHVNYRILASLMLSVGALSCGGGDDDSPAPPPVQAPARFQRHATTPPPAPPPAPAPAPIPPWRSRRWTSAARRTRWASTSGATTALPTAARATRSTASRASPRCRRRTTSTRTWPSCSTANCWRCPTTSDGCSPRRPDPACLYQLHNHDAGGRIHIEGAAPLTATLGNWFQHLGPTAVARQRGWHHRDADLFYVTDNGVVTRWDDDPALIELKSHRLITIQIRHRADGAAQLPPGPAPDPSAAVHRQDAPALVGQGHRSRFGSVCPSSIA